MRQRENYPAAGREVPERGLDVPGGAHPRGQPPGRHHRQPESLKPVPRVRAHRLPGQRAQLTAGRLGADHPAQVALKYPDPRAPAAPGTVGGTPETPPGPGLGQPAHHRPAQAIPGIGQPVPHRGHPSPPDPVQAAAPGRLASSPMTRRAPRRPGSGRIHLLTALTAFLAAAAGTAARGRAAACRGEAGPHRSPRSRHWPFPVLRCPAATGPAPAPAARDRKLDDGHGEAEGT